MQDFTSKRDALFACLDNASKELKGTGLDQSNANDGLAISSLESNSRDVEMIYRRGGNRRSHDAQAVARSLTHLRGKESIFKKPELPIGRCLKPRKTPDYKINPHKWKKYSLSDVDISEQTNTAAAFAFLKQMDEQRETNETAIADDELIDNDDNAEASTTTTTTVKRQKIEFKQSSKLRRQLRNIEKEELADAEMDKPRLRGSKLLMPEYVVGQKRDNVKQSTKGKQQKANTERAAGKLVLTHLQEDDDDDDKED